MAVFPCLLWHVCSLLISKSAERWLLALWLWRFLLLISADVWGSGVWATEQSRQRVCGGFEWWPPGPCGWCVSAWVKRLLGNMLCPYDSSLSVCKAQPLTRYWTTSVVAHGLWTHTKGITWPVSDTHTHPAAAMCEACFTSLSHACVNAAACSLSVFSVKTWEQWIVSCLPRWTHSVWVLTKGYELLAAERNAQLALTQNTHSGPWPISTLKLSY